MFGLALMAACTSTTKAPEPVEGPSPELCAIDSLMWRQPDSALAVLMNYLNDDGRDAARHVSTDESFNNHYANLLLAELLYKNDCEQTNRAELLQAVSYFDSLVRQAPPLKKTVQNTNEIDVSDLSEGVYLLRITDAMGVSRRERITVAR